MKKKAVALISGGLDSLLAARLVKEQGIKIIGVSFVMQFASRNLLLFKKQVKESAACAGFSVRFVDISEDFIEVLKNPRYGYGANLNPCIDCKILMLKKAKEIMEKENAGFVVTGEVLGERPMSQHKDALNIIKKRSAMDGYLLRPLSAKLLEETIPEKNGIINRRYLLSIQGRSRGEQTKLAKKYGIQKFFTPGGGCLLTDPIFSKKLKDLINRDSFNSASITLLKYGRHFRLDNKTKVILGRDDEENKTIIKLKQEKDILIRLRSIPGPYGLICGKSNIDNIEQAAAILVSHSKVRNEERVIVEFWMDKKEKRQLETSSMGRFLIDSLRV